MTKPYSHEGPSIWGWENFRRLAARFRFTVSRVLTPTTELLLTPGFFRTLEGEERSRKELEASVAAWSQDVLVGTRQCPAKHPVVPYELEVSMRGSRKMMIQVFPNFEANIEPWAYVPVHFYFCPVCQAVYRPREVEAVNQPSEESASA